MEERLAQLESTLERVQKRLLKVERRLAELEGDIVPGPHLDELVAPQRPDAAQQAPMVGTVTLLGRSLLIFGGAYLLRALTDAGLLSSAAGISLGLVYALLWLVLAYRGAAPAQRTSAAFYGATSILIALPILVEATTRFTLLAGGAAAVALGAYSALALAVAAVRNLRTIAWLTVSGATLTALVLMRGTRAPLPFSVYLLLLGLAGLWIAYQRGWKGLPWLAAGGADLGIVLVAVFVSSERWATDPVAAMVVEVLFVTAYLVSFAVRTHVQGRQAGGFEVVQGGLAVLIGFGTALRSAPEAGAATTALGAVGLALGAGAYALAFAPETRLTRRHNFFYYTSLGLVLVITGTSLLLPGSVAGLAWAVLAVALAWLSGRFGRVTLSLHCALYLLAATASSGLATAAAHAFVAPATRAWPPVSIWHLAVVAATVACLIIPVTQRSERWGRLARIPQLLVMLLAAWGLGGTLIIALAPVVGATPGDGADGAAVAALRTAVLAAAAVVLAWASRRPRWPEASWLVYPVLVAAGIKLVAEDFPHGRPVSLFVALALVGGALILSARLLRR